MFDWLFGSGRQASYDDTNKMYGQFDSARNEASNFYNEKIANTDWDSLDLGTKASLSQQYGQLDSKAKNLNNQYSQMYDLFNQEEKDNKNNHFGNGILGSILNPFAQTLDAGVDLVSGNYEKNGRDVASDLGALGESVLSLVPFAGGAMKAMKLGKAGNAVNKAVNSVPGMAAVGAGFGGLEALRQGGSETQLQDVLSQAGMGAAFGGGIPIAGRAVNKGLMRRGARNYNPSSVYNGLQSSGVNPIQAAMMAADPNSKTLRSVGMRNLAPKSNIGKIGLGGGAIVGGGMLMNGMGGGQQPAMDPSTVGGQMTEEQLYNYLVSQGMM